MMESIAIQLKGNATAPRKGEPLRFGVPLRQNMCHDANSLSVLDSKNTLLPHQLSPLAYWPDGSIRWLCVESQLTDNNATATLKITPTPTGQPASAKIRDADRHLTLSYGYHSMVVLHDSLAWQWTNERGHTFKSRVRLDAADDIACTAKLDKGWIVESSGPLNTRISASGWWQTNQGEELARFHCELAYFRDGLAEASVTIHNPRRARHPGGLWDLGDPGSIHFGALAVETETQGNDNIRLTLGADQQTEAYSAQTKLELHQESSGGEHWNSRNHVNANGQILPRFRGYRLTQNDLKLAAGNRCTPVVEVARDDSAFSACLPLFWQEFPSGIEAHSEGVALWLFPKNKPEPYELQGGERKAQKVILGYGKKLESISWAQSPVTPIVSAQQYEASGTFPWFNSQHDRTALDELIQRGVEGESSFFNKREVIDEYGWRNFGDLFADHETLYQEPNEAPYVSHYNNQYDGILGFARQFALTGNTRWFELMDDLARHVVDIDIYHTNADRAEYNHGLFWHTDHYLDAHTCTHRTFTRHNDSSSTPGQLGGGPAAEHCYTTGLLYHYWMTGCAASRQAVLDLANWMEKLHQGEPGFLSEVLALKKQELPKLKAMLRGDQVTPHRYPFTRGTGNYITALLDAHLLEPSVGWLERAETVIKQTMHPADDIAKRDLLDTETGWSYLILLASVARYLYIKEESGHRDGQWRYARDSFLHYAEWMLLNERPFLAETKDLEFANDTWTAQDIRKAMLMFQAAEQDSENSEAYRSKGSEWLNYVTSSLTKSPERDFTRLQVILLQNYGAHHLGELEYHEAKDLRADPPQSYKPPTLSWTKLFGQIMGRLMSGLYHFRPSREKTWLEARLDRQ